MARKLLTPLPWLTMIVTLVVCVAALVWLMDLPWSEKSSTDEGDQWDLGIGEDLESEPVGPVLRFKEVTQAAGISFEHSSGAYGERLLPETMGGGVAVLDYDGDGWQDLLFIDSGSWPWRDEDRNGAGRSTLYRNLGDGTFADVTSAFGFRVHGYQMGVAVGDYDRDGRVDVFVTALGANTLLRNTVGGFVDVSDESGIRSPAEAWSTGAAFLDFDRDGDLDLFVANYVVWSRERDLAVDYRLDGVRRAYGPPTDFAGTQAQLLRNDGGLFVDVSTEAGITVTNASGDAVGKALAVLPVDIDEDGWLDVVVANDTVRNFAFRNDRHGRFDEVGVDLGLAFDGAGQATGAMGLDAGYFANDGKLGIAIGNFANEMSSFFVRRAAVSFSDDSIVVGIGSPSRRALTFGLVLLDLDLDGRLDLVTANGHVEPDINRVQNGQTHAQPMQVFWNCAECRQPFRPTSVGELNKRRVGRGLAYADFDRDGDLDLVVTQIDGRAALLRNDTDADNHWLNLTPVVDARVAIGAEVRIPALGQHRRVDPTRSYLSQVEASAHFGLGKARPPYQVDVRWPEGRCERFVLEVVDTYVSLVKGAGSFSVECAYEASLKRSRRSPVR